MGEPMLDGARRIDTDGMRLTSWRGFQGPSVTGDRFPVTCYRCYAREPQPAILKFKYLG